MTMYNYILIWGIALIVIILLGLIVIRLGDIKDSLSIVDYDLSQNNKYIFMIFMGIRIILKNSYGINLVEFCNEYLQKIDNDEDIDFSENEEIDVEDNDDELDK